MFIFTQIVIVAFRPGINFCRVVRATCGSLTQQTCMWVATAR